MPTTDLDALQALLGPHALPSRTALSSEHGTTLPLLHDHHVHLHLTDTRAIVAGGIAAVLDLGGDPFELVRRPRAGIPRVRYAGAFLTAPGGYPVGRSWAPPATVREIANASSAPGVAGGARTAVDEQADAGAAVIKVTLNATAGPVLDPDTLAVIVAVAHERGLPVVAHVEGEQMTRRALDAGIDVLAHAPFSEPLDAALIDRAVAAGQLWISTLTIHGEREREQALANVRAFAAAGGRVLYGTDLGNGDQHAGVSEAELAALHEAGVRGSALVAALTDAWPAADIGEGALDGPPSGISTFVPGAAPYAADGIPAWLARARIVPSEELVHDGR